jgi:hypothetical protein
MSEQLKEQEKLVVDSGDSSTFNSFPSAFDTEVTLSIFFINSIVHPSPEREYEACGGMRLSENESQERKTQKFTEGGIVEK